jgi:hypothetical protein
MSDRDVIDWMASMFNRAVDVHTKRGLAGDGLGVKTLYRTRITGSYAIGILQTIYRFMGVRRRKKIRELIETWRARPYKRAR